MDYSKTYFGKPLNDLDYQDITRYFIEEREESTTIEFKSYSTTHGKLEKNIEGVIRGICAFLNSEGGILIWGAPSGSTQAASKRQVFQGALSPLSDLKDKDWIINKVSDPITPLPVGINVEILQDGSDVLYVFEVQKSPYAPHQYKSIYYARLDGQSKPAPHYLVEALMRRIQYPNIEGFIRLDRISNNGKHYLLDLTAVGFNFSEVQNEENVSFNLFCPQGIFNGPAKGPHIKYMHSGHHVFNQEFAKVLHFGAPVYNVERLIFNPLDVSTNHSNKVELVFSIGGKHSPLKFSNYALDFSRIDWNNQDSPNYLIESMEENVLAADNSKKVGKSKEELLKEFLKR